jgi:hypothetical protein
VNEQPIIADFVQLKAIPSRGVVQILFEAPIEDGDEVHRRLGGFPLPGSSRPCAIVTLDPEVLSVKTNRELGPPERQSWRKLPFVKQAGILCKDPAFQAWLKVDSEDAAAEQVRRICGCKESRRELDRNPDAAGIWTRLSDAFRSHRDRASQEASLTRR